MAQKRSLVGLLLGSAIVLIFLLLGGGCAKQEEVGFLSLAITEKRSIYEIYASARNEIPHSPTAEYAKLVQNARKTACSTYNISDTTLSYIEIEAHRNDWAPLDSESPAYAANAEALEQRHTLEHATLTRAPSGSFSHRTYPSSSSGSSHSTSSSASGLSHSTQQKIYYDMIATQDINPDSNSWNQGVKEAAADYYNVPMSTINEIIREGATNGWLQPDPP